MTRLVVITGADASGKSTLAEVLRRPGVRLATAWDAITQGFPADREAVQRYLVDLDPHARTLFLAHAVRRGYDLALRESPEVILAVGWWYKYAVSEMALGGNADAVRHIFTDFPRPDAVVCLDLAPEVAAARRPNPSLYEGGGKFLSLQRQMRPLWRQLETAEGPWTHLDATLPIEHLTLQAEATLGL